MDTGERRIFLPRLKFKKCQENSAIASILITRDQVKIISTCILSLKS